MASDDTQVKPLIESLLTEQPAYIGVIRDALSLHQHQPAVTPLLWEVLTVESEPASRRFRAALAAGRLRSRFGPLVAETTAFVARQLVDFNPEHQPTLREYLRPIRGKLLDELETLYRQTDAAETQLVAAASALADFTDDDEVRLADCWSVARRSSTTFSGRALPTPAIPDCSSSWMIWCGSSRVRISGTLERITLGRTPRRCGNHPLRQGAREEILPIFEFTDDPEAMTQFIHRCKARGVRAEASTP